MLLTEAKNNSTSVVNFETAILPHLSASDDARFWFTVLEDLTQEFLWLGLDERASHEIFLQIGACSHWLRPHQTRLTAAGGFALPAGYLGSGFSRDGLPEFDWFVLLHRSQAQSSWSKSENFFGKRQLLCRVALPTRTLQHNQAVINVLWSPGTPAQPKEKTKLFYAYRKIADEWKQVATGKL
jgi:hypothetical protein